MMKTTISSKQIRSYAKRLHSTILLKRDFSVKTKSKPRSISLPSPFPWRSMPFVETSSSLEDTRRYLFFRLSGNKEEDFIEGARTAYIASSELIIQYAQQQQQQKLLRNKSGHTADTKPAKKVSRKEKRINKSILTRSSGDENVSAGEVHSLNQENHVVQAVKAMNANPVHEANSKENQPIDEVSIKASNANESLKDEKVKNDSPVAKSVPSSAENPLLEEIMTPLLAKFYEKWIDHFLENYPVDSIEIVYKLLPLLPSSNNNNNNNNAEKAKTEDPSTSSLVSAKIQKNYSQFFQEIELSILKKYHPLVAQKYMNQEIVRLDGYWMRLDVSINCSEIFYVKDKKTNQLIQGSEEPQTAYHHIALVSNIIMDLPTRQQSRWFIIDRDQWILLNTPVPSDWAEELLSKVHCSLG